MREGRRQIQHDAPSRGLHPGAELQELSAQGAHLSPTEGRARRSQTQLLVVGVRGSGQKRSQLIGEEAAAAGSIYLKAAVRLLDLALDVTTSAVDRLIQVTQGAAQLRDQKARIVFGVPAGITSFGDVARDRRRNDTHRRYERSRPSFGTVAERSPSAGRHGAHVPCFRPSPPRIRGSLARGTRISLPTRSRHRAATASGGAGTRHAAAAAGARRFPLPRPTP